MSILNTFMKEYSENSQVTFTIEEYLEYCKENKLAYASAAERLIAAIGEPTLVDTSADPVLGRIFMNKTIRLYPAFKDFFGMEEVVEKIVGYFRHSAQGLEEKKQILYLLGPVGGGKSSLAEKIKELIEVHPIYALMTEDGQISPVFESPLGLFSNNEKLKDSIESTYGIDRRYMSYIPSPWAIKRLREAQGDLSKFRVVRLKPSRLEQIAVTKTEPGDDNNQDISSLVGKIDIRKLKHFSQNDPDAYSFSGALCRANQGVMEFVEMFKAPIKTLHPLLTATQEGNYVGTEAIGAIPFQGIVVSHSNVDEWEKFRNNKLNEAFIDRIYLVKVPYTLRYSEEEKIYKKMLEHSGLSGSPCAPQTLEMLAQFSVLTRLKDHENSTLYTKMKVYNAENMREKDVKAKTIQEYRDYAGVDEGMTGMSTRFAFKVLSQTFNYSPHEVAADPVHLMVVLENAIRQEQLGSSTEERYLNFIKSELVTRYAEFLGNEIQKAYIESYQEYGQNLFMRYLAYADAWIQDVEFKDPDTGLLLNREQLNAELEKIEKPAGISNPKDFRNEVVNYALRYKAKNGEDLQWTSYNVIRDVIEKRMFSQVEDLLPVISFESKKDKGLEQKHEEFVQRMKERGYTDAQVRRLVEWYMRVKKSN